MHIHKSVALNVLSVHLHEMKCVLFNIQPIELDVIHQALRLFLLFGHIFVLWTSQ